MPFWSGLNAVQNYEGLRRVPLLPVWATRRRRVQVEEAYVLFFLARDNVPVRSCEHIYHFEVTEGNMTQAMKELGYCEEVNEDGCTYRSENKKAWMAFKIST